MIAFDPKDGFFTAALRYSVTAVRTITQAEDRRFLESCAAPDPHAKKKLHHGPQKKGKGGKIKRW